MLEAIRSQDIKKLSISQLNNLAKEIRERLIEVTAKNGGHLAPNLGIVEMTLAFHYVYDFPKDKIIWDVGHQSYVHKLLTGRNGRFDTLRQWQGMSGFPKRSESPFDNFGAGHASTSISAGTGFALARDLLGEEHEVIAVIGDGAMTGGMAFEAMNHASQLNTKLTVVLNDNEMSIAPNVGGMSQYLTRLRSDPNYNRLKDDIETALKKIPSVGPKMAEIADKMKDSVKTMLVKGSFFEELGFKYYGPVDGHNIEEMIHVLENSKQFSRPVLIHCLTEKGRGYLPATKHPEKFHGIGAFDIETGETVNKSNQPSYTDVFSRTLIDLAQKDEEIIGITAAMGAGTGMGAFGKSFPDRMIDVGIAEEHATTMACALALNGLKPVVAIYSTFMQRAFDQLIHDCALQNAPVVFALDRAGLVGADGPTHHGMFDLSYLRMIPNMVIMAPKDETELQHMLYSALSYRKPVAIRYPRGKGSGNPLTSNYKIMPFGKGEEISEGKDATIFAVGSMVNSALEVAKQLEQEGLIVGVVNMRFIKPLDEEIINKILKQNHPIITMEENILAGGFGSAVLEKVNDISVKTPLLRLGIPDAFIEHGDTALLKKSCGLDVESMVTKIKHFLMK